MKQNMGQHQKLAACPPLGVSLVLLLALALASALAGCGSASSGPASSTTAVTTAGSTTTLRPTTTGENQYPVLTQLPRISLQDLALIDVREQASEAPLRVLSPAGDKNTVESLLAAYHKTVLKPATGYPQSVGPYQVTFRMRDGSYVEVELGKSREPATVRYAAKSMSRMSGPVPAASATIAEDFLGLMPNFTSNRLNAYDLAVLGPSMPPQFGIICAYGVGAKNVLDTFSGTFTKDLIVGPPATATANLSLTNAELTEIYRTLIEIDIQDYPFTFHPTDSTGTSVYVTPHQSYYLLISSLGIVAREVRWEDSILSTAPKAKALRNLFRRIQEMVEQKPEYRAMPRAQGGYL